jgi:hypothetical protein
VLDAIEGERFQSGIFVENLSFRLLKLVLNIAFSICFFYTLVDNLYFFAVIPRYVIAICIIPVFCGFKILRELRGKITVGDQGITVPQGIRNVVISYSAIILIETTQRGGGIVLRIWARHRVISEEHRPTVFRSSRFPGGAVEAMRDLIVARCHAVGATPKITVVSGT